MNDFDWITSEGGPLICVETALAASWGGIKRLSVATPGAVKDYDRACEGSSKALTSAPLQQGAALFFHGPFDTAFWRRASDGKVFVVRIEACEVDTDFLYIMNSLNDNLFCDPLETLFFYFETSDIIIFDSSESGTERDKKIVNFQISPASYDIKSKFVEIDQYSLLIHRFDVLE